MANPKAPSLGKVLVVGGCGFLGSHIVSLIVKRHPQTEVAVLDLRTTNNRNSSPTVSYHDGDITDYDAMKALFEKLKLDAVIHTASPHFNLANSILKKVNVGGTETLLKVSQETAVKAFVYTSSASVILDPTKELVNADETWPVIAGDKQPEYYTSTKAWAEEAVLEANRNPDDNFLTCAIRPAGIFGEGDQQNLPKVVGAYRKGQTKFQVGDNNNLFDFTYVENVAHGHLLATQALLYTHTLPTAPLDHEKVDGEAFFITNGQPVYFWDYARAVWHEAGDRLPLSSVWTLSEGFAMTIGAILENVFWCLGKTPNLTRQQVRYSTMTKYHSIDKARKRMGYKPIVDLDEGIKRGVRYILEQEKAQSEKKGQ